MSCIYNSQFLLYNFESKPCGQVCLAGIPYSEFHRNGFVFDAEMTNDLLYAVSRIERVTTVDKIAIYGFDKSGINVYNALTQKGYDKNIVCIFDRNIVSQHGILRNSDYVLNSIDFNVIIIATNPIHYSGILEYLAPKLAKGCFVICVFQPNFRTLSENKLVQFQAPAIIISNRVSDFYFDRVIRELLYFFDYDIKVSLNNDSHFLERIKQFEGAIGCIEYAAVEQATWVDTRPLMAYYFSDPRDRLLNVYRNRLNNCPAFRQSMASLSEQEGLKKIVDGYTYFDGYQNKVIRSFKDELSGMNSWLNDDKCFKIRHEDFVNNNVETLLIEFMAYLGLPLDKRMLDFAMSEGERLSGTTQFRSEPGLWKEVFDDELLYSVCQKNHGMLVQLGYEK